MTTTEKPAKTHAQRILRDPKMAENGIAEKLTYPPECNRLSSRQNETLKNAQQFWSYIQSYCADSAVKPKDFMLMADTSLKDMIVKFYIKKSDERSCDTRIQLDLIAAYKAGKTLSAAYFEQYFDKETIQARNEAKTSKKRKAALAEKAAAQQVLPLHGDKDAAVSLAEKTRLLTQSDRAMAKDFLLSIGLNETYILKRQEEIDSFLRALLLTHS